MIKSNYPLIEHATADLHAASGRPLGEITLAAAAEGTLTMADTQISAEALRAQAEVARQAGYTQLAENLLRAAELTAVPNAEVLQMYDMLRPGRATYAQLIALVERLETIYNAPTCAKFVHEAADVYQARRLVKKG